VAASGVRAVKTDEGVDVAFWGLLASERLGLRTCRIFRPGLGEWESLIVKIHGHAARGLLSFVSSKR
jgi:hypothetical protein